MWIVWSGGYLTFGHQCEKLVKAETTLRPGGTAVVNSAGNFEHMWLYQYGPNPGQ